MVWIFGLLTPLCFYLLWLTRHMVSFKLFHPFFPFNPLTNASDISNIPNISFTFSLQPLYPPLPGPAECAKQLNLTSRGNGKRNLESDARMLLSATICGIWCYHVAISCASEDLEKNIGISSFHLRKTKRST